MFIDKETPIFVGTKVLSCLGGVGNGYVFAVRGKPDPKSVRPIGNGIGVTGGGARYDVVFQSGHRLLGVGEGAMRSAMWTITSHVADAATMEAILDKSKTVSTWFTQEQDKGKFDAAVQAIRKSPEFHLLKQGDDPLSGTLAAKNIRIIVKDLSPHCRFTVHKVKGGSVAVEWTDGPAEDLVTECVAIFGGSISSPKTEATITPWMAAFGGCSFVTTNRNYSDGVLAKGIAATWDRFAGMLTGIERPDVESVRNGTAWSIPIAVNPLRQGANLGALIYGVLSSISV
ncbi:LPD29 domain-containing protein [Nitrospirillum amazonense]|uniref:LPD29 domain-containing protein n=1 Tax=Nitrospirillum amazonense TaxID=28077 RepID=UPI0024127B3D|nr:LPD29 domain-containing protein [Nitrospirillum amazonense]MDG3444650.1 hypothetical protein [Nitrospirillum amazonense]